MLTKIYTIDEMDQALPLVRSIVADVQTTFGEIRQAIEALGVGDGVIDIEDRELLRQLPWAVRDRIDDLHSLIAELDEIGLYLRDPDAGLVEAFGERDGEIVFYSWRPSESHVEFWHKLSDPQQERRPVHALTP